MNNEIKEILENCEKAINEASGYNNTTNKIIDYITNLQKENERLKENLQQEKKDFKEANDYCFELKDYKSRCENAYEELTYMSSSDYVEDYDIKQNCWIKLSNILQNGSENND